MVEMREKYPDWLERNKGKIEASEFDRFSEQFELVKQICVAYETNTEFDKIAILMENISSLGQAPADMLAEIVPEDGKAGEAFFILCIIIIKIIIISPPESGTVLSDVKQKQASILYINERVSSLLFA
jgi:hypothetical protein